MQDATLEARRRSLRRSGSEEGEKDADGCVLILPRSYPDRGEADLLVSPEDRSLLEAAGERMVKVLVEDVGDLIEQESR